MREAMVSLTPARRVAFEAVEVDPDAVRALRAELGAAAVHARVEDCKGPYDVVVMSHFLEHLRDPVSTLRAQRDLLAPDGLLFLEVPNGDHRFKDHHEPHLSFFETATLSRVVEAAGLRMLRVETCGAPVGTIQASHDRKRGALRSLWRLVKNPVRDARRRRRPELARAKPDPDVEAYGGDRRWLRAVARRD
jgi:SAM-dependent methyltransferase